MCILLSVDMAHWLLVAHKPLLLIILVNALQVVLPIQAVLFQLDLLVASADCSLALIVIVSPRWR